MSNENIHQGHRKRIDEKSRIMGFEFLEEHEQLEKLLFSVIPRGNTNEIAHNLLTAFGSLKGVLMAVVVSLKSVEGVGPRTAEFLHDLAPLLGIVERAIKNENRENILDSDEKIGEYVKTFFYGKSVESLYLFCISSANTIKRFDKVSEGTAYASDVSVSRVAKLAVLADAVAVILVHNHPGGKMEPSYADCMITREIDEALKVLGIQLRAHFIVSDGKWKKIMY